MEMDDVSAHSIQKVLGMRNKHKYPLVPATKKKYGYRIITLMENYYKDKCTEEPLITCLVIFFFLACIEL
jgi:hypothetical protein